MTRLKCELGCTNGHVMVDGKWFRCKCTERRIFYSKLGLFEVDSPKENEKLIGMRTTSVVFEGSMTSIRPLVAGVLVRIMKEGGTFGVIDAYQLVEIYLDKDGDFTNLGELMARDMVVMLLGFGEVKNQRLPDLIMQLLVRRDLLRKPIWVILGTTINKVAEKFGVEIAERISIFKKVSIK